MTQPSANLQHYPDPGPFDRLLNGAGLDAIKLIAAVAMLIDHANAIVFQWEYTWAYLIGRAAFPLFAFAAAASILRACDRHSVLKQVGLLLAFAVLSEPVSRIVRDYEILNVLFTLGFGVLIAPFYMRAPQGWQALSALAAILLTFCGGWWEFTTAGMLLPAALAVAIRGLHPAQWMIVVALVAAINFRGLFFYEAFAPAMMAATATAALILPLLVLLFVRDALPVSEAVPARRLMPRYFLHVFYPVHMIVLWLCQ